MKKYFFIILALCCFSTYSRCASKDTIFVASWNLENLFDTVDDPGKNDSEFTPEGSMGWTPERLNKKIADEAQVIRSMNDGNGPDLLGVVEVEHQALLDSMLSRHFSDKHYKIAYAESPDERGIDNGLIYNSDIFTLAAIKTDTIHLLDNVPTRLIFNVDLVMNKKDTIHVFVNHWPSRRGGEAVSEINRVTAAQVLRRDVQRLVSSNKGSKIIIIGDFNDEPGNVSIKEALGAHPLDCGAEIKNTGELYNASYSTYEKKEGTLKFQDTWNLLDQVIISDGLLTGKGLRYICGSYQIYRPDFMVTKTGKFAGTPHPTYGGKRYLGGYSDHFPVISKFFVVNNKTKKNKK